ncbi:AMP-binding protein [Mycobacterium branderi]|uniref:ATP-dependent acyl-CoA ligase n=1 Tax=Mycobacterium branderi TaxID=43348 RepID=A0A7I7WDV8_9MYCO|nr:AMP-binding protein [Mycobacterium branderi]MCV7231744.1 AMP-binding protein [Mycobacterium branderi]ORA40289.1 hypothetical protein BST20_06985 [Mycobacterium branderi]BBZ15604.1 ATP-dependent acyl-CoA ligase [Mycobacterium branderi]
MRALTVTQALSDRLNRVPDEAFLHCGALSDGWMTLAELDARSSRLAGGLAALGVHPGDRVAVLAPNRVEMIDTLFAMAKLGSVQVPLNYWLKGDLVHYQLQHCGARVLITDSCGLAIAAPVLPTTAVEQVVLLDAGTRSDGVMFEDLLQAAPIQPVAAQPGDLLSISYTAGTTAAPKGCMLSTGYYAAVGYSYGVRGWVIPGDRIYTSFPLFHASGQLVAFMSALVNDASIAVAPEFHASTFMRDAAALAATTLMGVGASAHAILDRPDNPDDDRHPFRLAVWVPLPAPRQLQFERRFATPVISEGYGQTECVPITASDVHGQRDRTTSGKPAPLIDVEIIDEHGAKVPTGQIGEITVRPRVPHAMFSGYWNQPAEPTNSGGQAWHRTGDAGRQDDSGFITVVDRIRDIIRRRGENVSSLYLENTLREMPGVADVAVCAVPSPLGEDDIKACIVETHTGALNPAAIYEFLRDRVAYFAMPRYVHVRDCLPVNALGRVMKQQLRDEGLPPGCWDFESLQLTVPRDERRASARG